MKKRNASNLTNNRKKARRLMAVWTALVLAVGVLAVPAFAAGDPLGIVNNLTSIISKDEKLVLRSINIDSFDGLFRGNLVVMINDNTRLESLIKKLRTVKGVKQVERI